MVSMVSFYSDNQSLNPADVYNFSVKLLLKRTKINKKRQKTNPTKIILRYTGFELSN